jgi:membrane protein
LTVLRRIRKLIEDWLFAPAAAGNPLTWPRRLLRYPHALLRDLLSGQLNLHAMGLVYQTLLALVPLIAFSFSILQVFGAHRELEPLIFEFFRPMGADAGALTQRVMQFADKVHGSLVGSVGLALLIWTLVGTLKKVEDSLNYVWHVEMPRSFTRRIAEYVGLLIIGPLLVGAVIGMSHLALTSRSAQLLTQLPFAGQLVRLAVTLVPYGVITGLFTVVYAFIPNTRVRLPAALVGGLTAGILWAATGRLFTALVLSSAHLTIVYAGFAIFIAALVWTYFGWLILLLGAQLSFYVQNPSYLRLGLGELRLSGAESERLAPDHVSGREAGEAAQRWSDHRKLRHASRATRHRHLARCRCLEGGRGLLVTTEDERRRLAAASTIRIGDVVAVARTHTPWRTACRERRRRRWRTCASASSGRAGNVRERTLKELLEARSLRKRGAGLYERWSNRASALFAGTAVAAADDHGEGVDRTVRFPFSKSPSTRPIWLVTCSIARVSRVRQRHTAQRSSSRRPAALSPAWRQWPRPSRGTAHRSSRSRPVRRELRRRRRRPAMRPAGLRWRR